MIHTYRRVSTAHQDLSPQVQEESIKNWLASRGMASAETRDYFDGGVSGSVPVAKRPQGSILMANAKKDDLVVVAKMDRLWRSTLDAAETLDFWCSSGVQFISIHENIDVTTAMGRFMSSVLAAFSELERSMIRERTSAALQAKMARGLHHGAEPFGWVVQGGKLVRNEREQAVLTLIQELAEAGLKQERIASYLNTHDHVSKRGGLWNPVKIQRALAFDKKMRTIGESTNPEVQNASTPNNSD